MGYGCHERGWGQFQEVRGRAKGLRMTSEMGTWEEVDEGNELRWSGKWNRKRGEGFRDQIKKITSGNICDYDRRKESPQKKGLRRMGMEGRQFWANSESVEEETPQQQPWDRGVLNASLLELVLIWK
ncbi:hypothetical protein P7K49_028208 [Saguinus oedipus]|uniref:Uncharacterized protein n=1 Tax=Saguinus oedipus TaxID=9490 RepID=A0ABQ9UCK8_SAGOE|nr:hypothetical protein P7K49_028208 [Saguinus oedipus]